MTAVRYPGNASFVQSRNYTRTPGANLPITRIVIHDMEWDENADTAESCAAMFASPASPQASCHFMVDSDSVIQGVEIDRIAWHAPPNRHSIGIEHAGYSSQSGGEWADAYSAAMLTRSAKLTAWLCATYKVPVVKLSVAELVAGRYGIVGHRDVSRAWRQTDHTDPGPNFPWAKYIAQVQAFTAGGTVSETAPTLQEIQAGILFYKLDDTYVNPLTVIKRTYDAVMAQRGILNAIAQAEANEVVDVPALAAAIVEGLPEVVTKTVDPQALAGAVADLLAARLRG